jgi:hypothetical protein
MKSTSRESLATLAMLRASSLRTYSQRAMPKQLLRLFLRDILLALTSLLTTVSGHLRDKISDLLTSVGSVSNCMI